jgi:HK97 family phage major capsid protein
MDRPAEDEVFEVTENELNEMERRYDALIAEGEQIIERSNGDTFDGEDAERYEEIKAEVKRLGAQIPKYRALISAAGNPAARMSGDGTVKSIQHMQRVTAYGDSDNDMRSRALKAVEEMRMPDAINADGSRDRLDMLVERHDESLHRHIVAASDPVYTRAFTKWLKNPVAGSQLWSADEQRAMEAVNVRSPLSSTGANGGFMLPIAIDGTLVLTSDGSESPMRKISTVRTTTTHEWRGVTTAGISAEWLGEAQQAADASPSMSQPTVVPQKAAAFVQTSFELLEDAGSLQSDLTQLIADAKMVLEDAAFVVGTGEANGQPEGIVTALQGVTASRVAGSSGAAGAADFVVADVFAVAGALPPRWRNQNTAWISNYSTLLKVRQFAQGSGGMTGAFWTDLNGPNPALLLGFPVYPASSVDASVVSGSNDDILILGDVKQYYVIDRLGMSLSYVPHIFGANARPTGQSGFWAHWRTSAKTMVPGAFRMLRI